MLTQSWIVALFIASPLFAEEQGLTLMEYAERITVRVKTKAMDVFRPEREEGHGSGFIVHIDETKGVVFTNRHVVENTNPFAAQRVTLAFGTGYEDEEPEEIPARVDFISPISDFAVVSFELNALTKETRERILVAKLPDSDGFSNFAVQGRDVVTYGHPLNGNNISTRGQISGKHLDNVDGEFIQVDAAINPGNSGGALIDMETGMVLGINTAIISGANSVGYATPITAALRDFEEWQDNPGFAQHRRLMAHFALLPKKVMEREGLEASIEALAPRFFNRFPNAPVVLAAHEGSLLQPGDIIVRVGEEVIGNRIDRLRFLVQRAHEGHISLTIIRNTQVEVVDAPVEELHTAMLRGQSDFVIISGLVVGAIDPYHQWRRSGLTSTVSIMGSLPYSHASEMGGLLPGSIIVGVQIGNRSYSIESMSQLKRALKHRSGNKSIRIVFHPPQVFIDPEEGYGAIVVNPEIGHPMIEPHTRIVSLPLSEVVTPENLSMRRIKAGIDFDGTQPERRDWRWWRQHQKDKCARALTKSS